jgi:hypothetical protein
MLRLFFLLIFTWPVSAAILRSPAAQEEPTAESPQVEVRSPLPGQALQGSVPVTAVYPGESVLAVEVSFSYTGDARETWFLIAELGEPAGSGELTTWDTTTLTDGVYSLRLVVLMEGGDQATVTVPGLRVRNYTPIETNTPAPPTGAGLEATSEGTTGTQVAVDVVTDTPVASPDSFSGLPELLTTPSPEPLPANPAQVSNQAVVASLGKGALAAGVAFLLLGIYRGVQQVIRSRRDAG